MEKGVGQYMHRMRIDAKNTKWVIILCHKLNDLSINLIESIVK